MFGGIRLESTIEAYIHKIVNELHCGEEEKKDMTDEMKDHLYLLIQEYKEDGFSNEVAVNKALETFGEQKQLARGLQTSISPFHKLCKITTGIFFGLYVLILFFKFFLERMILTATIVKSGDFFNPHVAIPENFTGAFDVEYIHLNANFLPFKTTLQYILNADSYNVFIIIENTIGNALVFLPLGIFLPLLFPKCHSLLKVSITVTIIISAIESLQLLLCVGQFDVDDIILGTIGSGIGFLCFLFFRRLKNGITAIRRIEKEL